MEFFTLSNDFLMMFIRLLINVVFTWLIIDRLYYRKVAGATSTSRSCSSLWPSSSSSSS